MDIFEDRAGLKHLLHRPEIANRAQTSMSSDRSSRSKVSVMVNQLSRLVKRKEAHLKLKNEKVSEQLQLVKRWWQELDPCGVKAVDKKTFTQNKGCSKVKVRI